MPREEFQPTIPMFERPKTVRDSDRSATVTGHKGKSKHVKLLYPRVS